MVLHLKKQLPPPWRGRQGRLGGWVVVVVAGGGGWWLVGKAFGFDNNNTANHTTSSNTDNITISTKLSDYSTFMLLNILKQITRLDR